MPHVVPPASRVTALLLAGAALSMVVGMVVARSFFYVWVSNAQTRAGLVIQITLMVTVPIVLIVVAVVRVEAGPVRRLLAILVILSALPALLLGVFSGQHVQLVATSVAASALLAAWAIVQRPRPAARWLVVAPILVIAVLAACRVLAATAVDVPLPLRSLAQETQHVVFLAVPLLTAVVSGPLIARSGRTRSGAGVERR